MLNVEKHNIQPQSNDSTQEVQNLVYGLAHDMGAPLRAVVQFSQMLTRKLDIKLDDKERYWLQLISDNGLQAQAMIEGLLDYSRLTNQAVLITSFDIDSVIQSAIKRLSREIKASTAIINYIPCHQEIEGDKSQWTLCLYHLLSNAMLFQPKEASNQPEINIKIDSGKQGLTIVIEDNGIGIAENRWAEVARPFKRLNKNEDYAGVGMGLCICQRILNMHHWNMRFTASSLGGLAVTCYQVAKELHYE